MNRKRDLELISEAYTGMGNPSIDLMTFLEMAFCTINEYGKGLSDNDRAERLKPDYMQGLSRMNTREYSGERDFSGHAAEKMGVDGAHKISNVRRILVSGSKVNNKFVEMLLRDLNTGGKALVMTAVKADPYLTRMVTGSKGIGTSEYPPNKLDTADRTGIPKIG